MKEKWFKFCCCLLAYFTRWNVWGWNPFTKTHPLRIFQMGSIWDDWSPALLFQFQTVNFIFLCSLWTSISLNQRRFYLSVVWYLKHHFSLNEILFRHQMLHASRAYIMKFSRCSDERRHNKNFIIKTHRGNVVFWYSSCGKLRS